MKYLAYPKSIRFCIQNFIGCLFLCGFFASCVKKDKTNVGNGDLKVLYGAPVPMEFSHFTMIPIKVISPKDIADAYYLSQEEFAQIVDDCHNIVFHDQETNKNHLLTTQTFKRMSYHFIEIEKNNEEGRAIGVQRFILYKTVKEDTNKDGEYNWTDATVMYISDDKGKNFKSLTPDGTCVIDWTVEYYKGEIFFRILNDSDQNGVFDLKDDINIIRVNLQNFKKAESSKDHIEANALIKNEDRSKFEEMILDIHTQNKK